MYTVCQYQVRRQEIRERGDNNSVFKGDLNLITVFFLNTEYQFDVI